LKIIFREHGWFAANGALCVLFTQTVSTLLVGQRQSGSEKTTYCCTKINFGDEIRVPLLTELAEKIKGLWHFVFFGEQKVNGLHE